MRSLWNNLMPRVRRQDILLLFLLSIIFVAAWIIQEYLFMNWDVAWLLNATRNMLQGGTYTHDFYSPNPPMIMYLYVPPVILAKWLAINSVLVFRGYIFFLSSLSLAICYSFTNKIFSKQDSLLACAFVVALAVAFLIAPFPDFGQRDCLTVALSMPYLLMCVYRLQEKVSLAHPRHSPREVNLIYASMIGLLATLGFAMKPQFLVIPFLIEVYYAFHMRNFFSWMRAETLAIIATMIIYVISIFMFFQDFVFVITPYVIRNYYESISEPWEKLLSQPIAVFCYLPILFYFLQYRKIPYKILRTVLLIALIGSYLSYFMQHTLYFYHLIPIISFAILLMVVQFGLFAARSAPARASVRSFTLTVVLGMLLFAFPVFQGHIVFLYELEYKEKVLNKLIAFMRNQGPHQSIYVFSRIASYYSSPLNAYTDTSLAQRFDSLWMVRGLRIKILDLSHSPEETALRQVVLDKKLLTDMIAEDLHNHKPDLILVDDLPDPKLVKWSHHFDYVAFFSDNPKFRYEWKSYQYLTTLDDPSAYKLRVYKRIYSANSLSPQGRP